MPTIIRPLFTEKSLKDAKRGVYTFDVGLFADKKNIALQIGKLYKVHVIKVTTAKVAGKTKIVGKKRTKVKRPNRKKARVTLTAGETIAIFNTGEGT
jgi:large subunit ribosomal protein L23